RRDPQTSCNWPCSHAVPWGRRAVKRCHRCRSAEISHAFLSGRRGVVTAGQVELAAVNGRFFWYTNLYTQPAISFRLNKVRRSVCEVRHHVPQIEESMEIAKVEKWDFGKGLMTLDKIREMFTPAAHFRITRSEYPAGAEFSEASREGACYVLQGNVT